MIDVVFPQYNNQRYWNIHFMYVLNIFKHLNYNITYADRGEAFIVTLNGKDFLFDYSDSAEVAKSNLPIFKFHTNEEDLDKVIPFPSVSFYNWTQYESLAREIQYNHKSTSISNRQRAYGNATERRNKVKHLLKSKVNSNDLLTGLIDQVDFWKEVNNILVYIHVPGHHNNMIDRATMQYFAFGCPVITPHIPEQVPFYNTWDGCYIKCKDDYSDLEEILEYFKYRNHTHIGLKAKRMFRNNCTPEAVHELIKQHI